MSPMKCVCSAGIGADGPTVAPTAMPSFSPSKSDPKNHSAIDLLFLQLFAIFVSCSSAADR